MQLMEVDAAARSLPHKLWQERRLQERLHGILLVLPALPALGLWLCTSWTFGLTWRLDGGLLASVLASVFRFRRVSLLD